MRLVAEVLPSPNFGERKDGRRPDMIVLHYTGMLTATAALEHLRTAASQVSAHYFVFEDGRVVQMVPESKRAWHAGAAVWAGETDINSCSIGIEIANPGHDYGYPDFPKRQIAAVTALCRGILTRNTIPPESVLGHSDVAPARKQDPGEKFPWRTLHEFRRRALGQAGRSSPTARCWRLAIAATRSRRCRHRSRVRLRRCSQRQLRFRHARGWCGVPASFPARARRRRLRRIDPKHAAGPARPSRPAANHGCTRHNVRAARHRLVSQP